jgi:hypothetical protein
MKLSVDSLQAGEPDDRRRNPDRRAFSRKKVLKSGRTFWPNGDSSECVVFNLSETGAQLEVRGPAPNVFDLAMEGDRWRRSCRVVWRKASRIGVKFDQKLQLSPPSGTISLFAECLRYAEKCRELAERAGPPEREVLLEMAEMWIKVVRRLRRKTRE